MQISSEEALLPGMIFLALALWEVIKLLVKAWLPRQSVLTDMETTQLERAFYVLDAKQDGGTPRAWIPPSIVDDHRRILQEVKDLRQDLKEYKSSARHDQHVISTYIANTSAKMSELEGIMRDVQANDVEAHNAIVTGLRVLEKDCK